MAGATKCALEKPIETTDASPRNMSPKGVSSGILGMHGATHFCDRSRTVKELELVEGEHTSSEASAHPSTVEATHRAREAEPAQVCACQKVPLQGVTVRPSVGESRADAMACACTDSTQLKYSVALCPSVCATPTSMLATSYMYDDVWTVPPQKLCHAAQRSLVYDAGVLADSYLKNLCVIVAALLLGTCNTSVSFCCHSVSAEMLGADVGTSVGD